MSHILIIDDDRPIRVFLRTLLESEGYSVMEASNGKEGVRCYHDYPADLIITDIIMPDMEGIETIVTLKKEYPDVRIIAMSGGGRIKQEGYLEVAKMLGAKKTFEKPIRKAELLEAIKQIIREN